MDLGCVAPGWLKCCCIISCATLSWILVPVCLYTSKILGRNSLCFVSNRFETPGPGQTLLYPFASQPYHRRPYCQVPRETMYWLRIEKLTSTDMYVRSPCSQTGSRVHVSLRQNRGRLKRRHAATFGLAVKSCNTRAVENDRVSQKTWHSHHIS